jgi:hypothetical protein
MYWDKVRVDTDGNAFLKITVGKYQRTVPQYRKVTANQDNYTVGVPA